MIHLILLSFHSHFILILFLFYCHFILFLKSHITVDFYFLVILKILFTKSPEDQYHILPLPQVVLLSWDPQGLTTRFRCPKGDRFVSVAFGYWRRDENVERVSAHSQGDDSAETQQFWTGGSSRWAPPMIVCVTHMTRISVLVKTRFLSKCGFTPKTVIFGRSSLSLLS